MFMGSTMIAFSKPVAGFAPHRSSPALVPHLHAQSLLRASVAERNLEPDDEGGPIRHPMIEHFFKGFENGAYVSRTGAN